MEAQDILRKIEKTLGETDLVWVEDQPGCPYLVVPTEKVRQLASYLKGDSQLAFDTLMCLSGVHQEGDPDQLEVVYHLFSIQHRHRFIFKVKMDRPDPSTDLHSRVDTVSDIWPAAGWMEREVYDMFGIHFPGHKDFRRLLLPIDWQGYPLLKDYEESASYREISTTREDPEEMEECA